MANVKNFGLQGVASDVQFGKGGGRFKFGTGVFSATGADGTTLVPVSGAGATQQNQFATLAQVQGSSAGLFPHPAVQAATTASISVNGSGVAGSATWVPDTGISNGTFTGAPAVVDGVTLVNGDRVLVRFEGVTVTDGNITLFPAIQTGDTSTGTGRNGIYQVVDDVTGEWVRANDYDETNELRYGAYVLVTGGTLNEGAGFTMSSVYDEAVVLAITNINETPQYWVQFAKAVEQTASLGVEKVGNDFRLDISSLGTTPAVATDSWLPWGDATLGGPDSRTEVSSILALATSIQTGATSVATSATDITFKIDPDSTAKLVIDTAGVKVSEVGATQVVYGNGAAALNSIAAFTYTEGTGTLNVGAVSTDEVIISGLTGLLYGDAGTISSATLDNIAADGVNLAFNGGALSGTLDIVSMTPTSALVGTDAFAISSGSTLLKATIDDIADYITVNTPTNTIFQDDTSIVITDAGGAGGSIVFTVDDDGIAAPVMTVGPGLVAIEGIVSVTGSVSAASGSFTGNVSAGSLSAVDVTASSLTEGRVVLAGLDGLLVDDAGLTYDGVTLSVAGDVTATGAGSFASVASTGAITGLSATISGAANVGTLKIGTQTGILQADAGVVTPVIVATSSDTGALVTYNQVSHTLSATLNYPGLVAHVDPLIDADYFAYYDTFAGSHKSVTLGDLKLYAQGGLQANQIIEADTSVVVTDPGVGTPGGAVTFTIDGSATPALVVDAQGTKVANIAATQIVFGGTNNELISNENLTFVSGNLTVGAGSISANTTITAGTGLTVSSGGAAITGNSTITGILNVTQSATIGTGLTVTLGGADITGATTVAGPISTTGALGTATFSGALTVAAGGAAITGNSTVTGTLGVSAAATVGGNLTVTGTASTGALTAASVTASDLVLAGGLVFTDALGKLTQDAGFTYNATTDTLTVTNLTATNLTGNVAQGAVQGVANQVPYGDATTGKLTSEAAFAYNATTDTLSVSNIALAGTQTISGTGANADILIVPNGTGEVVIGAAGPGVIGSEAAETLSLEGGAGLILDGGTGSVVISDAVGTIAVFGDGGAAWLTVAGGLLATDAVQLGVSGGTADVQFVLGAGKLVRVGAANSAAYITALGAAGANPDAFVTKGYVESAIQTGAASGSIKAVKATVDLGTAAATNIGALLPAGATILKVKVSVTAASATATLEVGKAGATAAYMTAAENDPAVTGIYVAEDYVVEAAAVQVIATVATPAVGSAVVFVEYQVA